MTRFSEDEIRSILYTFINKKIDKGRAEYETLHTLLNNHPAALEKIGVGIDYFYVQRSKWKKNQFNFMICRLDGSVTDFSFIKCLHPKRKLSKNRNWGKIFREIIKDQIETFRKSAFEVVGVGDKFTCSETKLKFKKIYAHVDHVYPLTFDSIICEYIELNKLDLNSVALSEDAGTSEIQKILDESIVNDFWNFHKDRAVLRIVCNIANMQSKKTKNYNGECPISAKQRLLDNYPQYHFINAQ